MIFDLGLNRGLGDAAQTVSRAGRGIEDPSKQKLYIFTETEKDVTYKAIWNKRFWSSKTFNYNFFS